MERDVLVDGRGSDPVADEDFSGRHEGRFCAIAATFEGCDFSRTQCRNVSMGEGTIPTVYRGCCFDGAKLTFLPGGAVQFEDCSFVGAQLSKWSASMGSMIRCHFSSAALSQCIFWGPKAAHIQGLNPFAENDFADSDMQDCSFRAGIDLTAQVLPTGPGYFYAADGRAAVEAARQRIAERPEEFRAAESILKIHQREIDRGQEQVFDAAATWRRVDRGTWEALWGISR